MVAEKPQRPGQGPRHLHCEIGREDRHDDDHDHIVARDHAGFPRLRDLEEHCDGNDSSEENGRAWTVKTAQRNQPLP
jgi:hypothetical protein